MIFPPSFSTYNLFMASRWEKVPGTKWEILLLCKNLCDDKKKKAVTHWFNWEKKKD